MIWRFLDTGGHDGAFNMAVDEALFRRCRAGDCPPVFRVYRWNPWTISLGRMEDAALRLDLAACRKDGVPVVRRPTGGRAVYHAEELTYSFVARHSDLPVDSTIGGTYRFVARALVEALRSLGVPAEIWPRGSGAAQSVWNAAGRGELRRGPCFASVSQYEICVGGKKLVGSAQRRWPEGILQHGSILLGSAHRRIGRYLRGGSSADGEALASRTTSVSEELERPAAAEGLVEQLKEATARIWNVEMEEDRLGPEDLEEVEKLRKLRYEAEGWGLGDPN
ncbi:MAG: lipoate--protein ligase family protein [Candidatus Eisenbacteria sp.]|nr:lipoate--protein ligase family protein [Candidatus Eisenbacteria bacterium]